MTITDIQQAVVAHPDPTKPLDLGNGTYTLTSALYVRDRSITGSGATIIVPDSLNDVGIRCRGSVQLLGDVKVVGSKPQGTGYTPAREFQHGILANGVTSLVCNWSVEDVWGDGVYVGLGPDLTRSEEASRLGHAINRWSENVVVSGGHVFRAGRQALSVVAGRNVTFDSLAIEDPGRSIVDLEPLGSMGVETFAFTNSTVKGGDGYLLANKGSDHASCKDITIENIQVAAKSSAAIKCWSFGDRRLNYRIAKIQAPDVDRFMHPPFTFYGIDGLQIEQSTCNVKIHDASIPLAVTHDCTSVVLS